MYWWDISIQIKYIYKKLNFDSRIASLINRTILKYITPFISFFLTRILKTISWKEKKGYFQLPWDANEREPFWFTFPKPHLTWHQPPPSCTILNDINAPTADPSPSHASPSKTPCRWLYVPFTDSATYQGIMVNR